MINTHSCGARWTGASRAHFAGCHQTFSSDSAWQMHRRGLACRAPEDSGLIASNNPHGGVIWKRPGTWAAERERDRLRSERMPTVQDVRRDKS